MTYEPSGEPYDWTIRGKPEKPWKHPYHKIIVTKLGLCSRTPEGDVGDIRFTFEQALDVVRKFHNLIPDMTKIIYIVGWQFNGHDSKYPSWAEVNEHLKRPQDKDAVTSLRWLMQEAKAKYNTLISLHINMLDAYPDSPLWDEYMEKDIICKNKDGSVRWSHEWGGMTAACISYYKEWQYGLAQKRIDELVEMLPELRDAGTIHIDAFQAYDCKNRRVSDYLDHTLDDEIATMWKIYRYWRDKHGIDATAETFVQKRDYKKIVDGEEVVVQNSFAGVQPFCWWDYVGNPEVRRFLNSFFPPQIYTKTLLPLAPCFNVYKGQSWKEDDQKAGWRNAKRSFFTTTVPHYLRNVAMEQGEEVSKEVDVHVRQERDHCHLIGWRQDNAIGLWCHELDSEAKGLKEFPLPESWQNVDRADVYDFDPDKGWQKETQVEICDGKLIVPIDAKDGRILVPA